jgi:hypothetical protein
MCFGYKTIIMNKLFLSLLFFILISSLTFGEFVEQTSSATVPYIKKGFSSKPSSSDIQTAVKQAKVNALERYISSQPSSKFESFEKIKSIALADIESFVPEANIISQSYDKSARTISIVAKVAINQKLIDLEIKKMSRTSNISEEDRPIICSIFVTREAVKEEEFLETVKRAKRNEKSTESFEEVISDGNAVSVVGDISQTDTQSSGGSNTRRASEITYKASFDEDFNSAMSKGFASNNFEILDATTMFDASDGLVNIDEIISDYSVSESVTKESKSKIQQTCAELEIAYYSTGSMTVLAPIYDQINRVWKVPVSIIGNVYKQRKLGSKILWTTVASIEPKVISGAAEDQSRAKKAALAICAEKAVEDIINQLRNRNI